MKDLDGGVQQVSEKRRSFLTVIPGECWHDERDDTWFKVTAYDESTGVILGYRLPPVPKGKNALTWHATVDTSKEPEIASLDDFRKWYWL